MTPSKKGNSTTMKNIKGRRKLCRNASGKICLASPPSPLPSPSSRADDDSGLGGDSSSSSAVDFHFSEIYSFNRSTQHPAQELRIESNKNGGFASSSPLVKDSGKTSTALASPGLTFDRFGIACTGDQMQKENVHSSPKSKRARSDFGITEEANELPSDHKSAATGCLPKIVSFKNVPELNLCNVNEYSNFSGMYKQHASSILTQLPQVSPEPISALIKANGSDASPLAPLTSSSYKASARKDKKKSRLHFLEGNLSSSSSDGRVHLRLLSQPEGQHRARYQTEGSRGAVKDREGTGHPSVKLVGYKQKAILQAFVASDGGSVTPHLFYQACKVCGKNSTHCKEEKVHGTTVLEIDMLPEKDMTVSCDCVGILKERNVDVEQRLKSFVSRSKKKSTKCRLVFRTTVALLSGQKETLQVVSQPINCTQPPGVPEICRKSLENCSVNGGNELFIIGKNFSKDTEVVFKQISTNDDLVIWTEKVTPEKNFLQTTHLICKVPPYHDVSITCEVSVEVMVSSCGKLSDTSIFVYLPNDTKKGKRENSAHQQCLSKGALQSAVKLNQVKPNQTFTQWKSNPVSECSNNFSAKEVYYASNLSTNNNHASNKGYLEDRAMIAPHFGSTNCVMSAAPVQTTASLRGVSLKRQEAVTVTTPTVMAPKLSLNSLPLAVTTQDKEVFSTKEMHKIINQQHNIVSQNIQFHHNSHITKNNFVHNNIDAKNFNSVQLVDKVQDVQTVQNILENQLNSKELSSEMNPNDLIQLLRLSKILPSSLQSPVVDWLADVLGQQMKCTPTPSKEHKVVFSNAESDNLSLQEMKPVQLAAVSSMVSTPVSVQQQQLPHSPTLLPYNVQMGFQSSVIPKIETQQENESQTHFKLPSPAEAFPNSIPTTVSQPMMLNAIHQDASQTVASSVMANNEEQHHSTHYSMEKLPSPAEAFPHEIPTTVSQPMLYNVIQQEANHNTNSYISMKEEQSVSHAASLPSPLTHSPSVTVASLVSVAQEPFQQQFTMAPQSLPCHAPDSAGDVHLMQDVTSATHPMQIEGHDPLLSQGSAVTDSMNFTATETSVGMPVAPVGSVSTVVSMSDTELLNYIDTNCFENESSMIGI